MIDSTTTPTTSMTDYADTLDLTNICAGISPTLNFVDNEIRKKYLNNIYDSLKTNNLITIEPKFYALCHVINAYSNDVTFNNYVLGETFKPLIIPETISQIYCDYVLCHENVDDVVKNEIYSGELDAIVSDILDDVCSIKKPTFVSYCGYIFNKSRLFALKIIQKNETDSINYLPGYTNGRKGIDTYIVKNRVKEEILETMTDVNFDERDTIITKWTENIGDESVSVKITKILRRQYEHKYVANFLESIMVDVGQKLSNLHSIELDPKKIKLNNANN